MNPLLILALIPAVPLAAAIGGLLIAVMLGRTAECWRFMLPLFLGLASLAVILMSWPPRFGFDLSGGSVLTYRVESYADGDQPDSPGNINELVRVVQRRIDPGGVGYVTVRRAGDREIEILIPGSQPELEEHIRQVVRPRGLLEFRIVADPNHDRKLCELADQSTDLTVKKIVDESGRLRARWVSAGRPIDPDRAGEGENWGRFTPQDLASMYVRTCDDGSVEVLVVEDSLQVGGNHIASVGPSVDGQLRPCLNFQMTARGAALFGALTGANLPDRATDRYAKLGIILDGKLVSAPRINDRITSRGQITGNFTEEEVRFLATVLRVGALPMNLGPVPWSLTRVPGGQVARWAVWGVLATVAALLLVSGWSVIRHGGRGLAASAAAWLMVPLLLAGLMMIHVPVTFPAVATACGLVLLSAIALAIVCGAVTIPPNTATYADGTGPPIFLSRAWPVLVIFSVLFMTGAAAYAVGIGAARGVGVVLAMGAASGVASTLLCCWPLWSMPAKVLTAIVVEFDDVQ